MDNAEKPTRRESLKVVSPTGADTSMDNRAAGRPRVGRTLMRTRPAQGNREVEEGAAKEAAVVEHVYEPAI